MIYKLQTKEFYDEKLEFAFACIDPSFMFGSENEWVAELMATKFADFWDYHVKHEDFPDEAEIKEFASNFEDELYEMEGLAEMRVDD